MNAVWMKLLNMSAAGTVLILAVALLRLLLKKAPRWILCAMWALVALRLVCPVSLPSPVSAFRAVPALVGESGELELFRADGGETALPPAVGTPQADAGAPAEPGTAPAHTQRSPNADLRPLWIVYAVGVAAMLLYAVVSTLALRRKLSASLPLEEAACQDRQRKIAVRICDDLQTPLIFGLFRPTIYLPSRLSEAETAHVLAHERAHLRRLDHLWKPLGFLILSLHWFNPFCWLAYALLCRDIELACDEKVILELGFSERAAYMQTLLNCSTRHRLAACPVAFGETGVKARVKAVLNYKKPAFWLILAAVLSGVVLIVCLAAKPLSTRQPAQPFTLEENTARNGVSYPYLVRTESATWYLAKADMDLLGEEAYMAGFEALLQNAERDFADARAALDGCIDAEIPPVNVYTDFSGKAEEADLSGAYYTSSDRTIRLFHGWDVAAASLLHEYVHYLTFSCCASPIREGFYAEGVAEYVSNFACENNCACAAYQNLSEEEKALARARGIWDETRNSVDLARLYVGTAEYMRSEYSVGSRYKTVYNSPMIRTEQQLQAPTYTVCSYHEAGSIVCYLVERFGLETLSAIWGHDPAEMEQDLGVSYPELYEEWGVWNGEKRVAMGVAPPDLGS